MSIKHSMTSPNDEYDIISIQINKYLWRFQNKKQKTNKLETWPDLHYLVLIWFIIKYHFTYKGCYDAVYSSLSAYYIVFIAVGVTIMVIEVRQLKT